MDAAQQLGQGGLRGGENRKRNTMTNMMSKQGFPKMNPQGISGGGLPTLDPSATANYYGQLQTLQSQLMTTIAGLRAERKSFRGAAQVARKDVRQEAFGAMNETVNASLERGMLGSSNDLSNRIGVKAAMSSGITDVNRQLFEQLAQNRINEQQAALSYEQGVQQVEAQAISQRMNLAAQELQNKLAIQVAQMQAAAAQTSSDAQMAMAQSQLKASRQQAQALRDWANNWQNPYVKEQPSIFTTGSGLRPPGVQRAM